MSEAQAAAAIFAAPFLTLSALFTVAEIIRLRSLWRGLP